MALVFPPVFHMKSMRVGADKEKGRDRQRGGGVWKELSVPQRGREAWGSLSEQWEELGLLQSSEGIWAEKEPWRPHTLSSTEVSMRPRYRSLEASGS